MKFLEKWIGVVGSLLNLATKLAGLIMVSGFTITLVYLVIYLLLNGPCWQG